MVQKLLNYEVLGTLGEGAGSVIYRVVDRTTGREYALKHVVRDTDKDIRFVEQMTAEFELSKQFNHPNLRRSYDLKINKTMLLKTAEAFLVMELVEGRALDQHLPPALTDVVDTFIHAAQGLKYMHAMGYVHCDIKPNNILRSGTGMREGHRLRPIGQDRHCQGAHPGHPRLHRPRAGRPQADLRPNRRVQPRRDHVLGHHRVTHIPTLYTVNKKGENSFLVDERFKTPQDLNPKVPNALSNLVMECIATQPRNRPSNMDQVVTRLELTRFTLNRPPPNPNAKPNPTDALSDSNF